MPPTACPSCGREPGSAGPAAACPACGEGVNRPRLAVPEVNRPRIAGSVPRTSSAPAWILAGVAGILVLGLLYGVYMFVGQRGFAGEAYKEVCRENLKELFEGVGNYESEVGQIPERTGSGFWIEIARHAESPELLMCPAAMFGDFEENVPYRGPAVPWSQVARDGIVACDRARSHKDGLTVLLKDGRILFAPNGSDLHRRALHETRE